eukprot:gene19039-19389_t
MQLTGEQHPKWSEQVALEDEMRSLGSEKYRLGVAKAIEDHRETRTLPVRRLMDDSHAKVVEGIKAFFKAAESGKAGPKQLAYRILIQLEKDIDLVAHLAVRHVLDGISSRDTLTTVATNLAAMVEDELHFRAFKAAEETAYKSTMKRLKAKTNERYKRTSTRMTASKMGVEAPAWPDRDKILVGSKLVEIVIETTGLAQLVLHNMAKNHSKYVLAATQSTLDWMNSEHSRVEWLAPAYMPCLIPPKPWTSPTSGGYWTNRARRLTLVKTPNREYLTSLAAVEMPRVYSAINGLQETAWAINKRILAVMRQLWDNGTSMGVIPEVDPAPTPNRPDWLTTSMTKEEMTEDQLHIFLKWKSDCVRVHDGNAMMEVKRLSFWRMKQLAAKYEEVEEFFYPYQLDFRGRVYPVSLFLQPQGDDAQRGLLEFSNSVPINDEAGALWLAVHGAGCWGVDKLSLEAREAWVIEHDAEIRAAAADPIENRFWTAAEKPWQALAFCFDWAGYRDEGLSYLSALPVQMDGTCNGLQNFSAILRDPIGGAAVNLVPADRPQDIYQKVADLVSIRVARDLSNDTRIKLRRKDDEGNKVEVEGPTISSIAQGWLGKVTRKVCKRPVMTLAYGAREFGFRTQVMDDTVTPWKKEDPNTFPWDGNGWDGASYLGGVIWDCVGEVVIAAREAMDWLQRAARVAAKADLPVNWTTPDGFIVHQAYRVLNTTRIELTFEKVIIRPRLALTEQKLDSRKQASSISPNWVHSLDGCHMRETINSCMAIGMRSFSFIHDSYGTHAGNASILAGCLRAAFVQMYSDHDVLAELAEDLQMVLPEGAELPELPQMGTLDLSQVLESPFFFA